jgi:hypothetical protein
MNKSSEIQAVFSLAGLELGRCLGSKSLYRSLHQPNRFIPNANIFVTPAGEGALRGKIWWGDLDVERCEGSLAAASRLLSRKLFILTESDGRWGNENLPHRHVVRRAVATVWRGTLWYSAPMEPNGGSWW